MSLKLIGALCVVAGCGGFGFMIAAQHMAKIHLLRNLISVLDYMTCELQYRCTALPKLCRQAGQQSQGKIRILFQLLAEELEAQISPDVGICMASALDKLGAMERPLPEILLQLGQNLGKFDLSGQLKGLQNSRDSCTEQLRQLTENKDSRLRSYQTLGLCAGAALAILFV